MTLETFAHRLGAALSVGGVCLFVAAWPIWITAGGSGAIHSIHLVAGYTMAVAAALLVGIGLAIAAIVPADAPRRGPQVQSSAKSSGTP